MKPSCDIPPTISIVVSKIFAKAGSFASWCWHQNSLINCRSRTKPGQKVQKFLESSVQLVFSLHLTICRVELLKKNKFHHILIVGPFCFPNKIKRWKKEYVLKLLKIPTLVEQEHVFTIFGYDGTWHKSFWKIISNYEYVVCTYLACIIFWDNKSRYWL